MKAISLFTLSVLVFSVSTQAQEPIAVAGSSTLKPALQVWAEAYGKQKPGVSVSVSGDGSGSGFRALSLGQADLAASSRPIQPLEAQNLKAIQVEVEAKVVGLDALSLFVHPANPLPELSVAQLREIFGEGGQLKKWDELKVSVPGCKSGRIELVGRPETSGTYADFAQLLKAPHGLKLARAKVSAKEVIASVAENPCAIGYGAYTRNDTVRALCLSGDNGGACVTPEQAVTARADYPFLRELYLYVPKQADEHVQQFLAWSQSKEAACAMQKSTSLIPSTPVDCS